MTRERIAELIVDYAYSRSDTADEVAGRILALTAPEGEAQPVAWTSQGYIEALADGKQICASANKDAWLNPRSLYRHPAPPNAAVEALREIAAPVVNGVNDTRDACQEIAARALLTTEGET